MKTNLACIIGLSIMMMSCNVKNSKVEPAIEEQKDTISTQAIVGNDADEHGCKASTGFTWSEALQKCIRVWESGIEMKSLQKPDATSATYIVFSEDKAQVELFYPEKDKAHPLLNRMKSVSDPKKEVWSSDKASNGLKVYQDAKKLWVIEQDGKVQYQEVKK